MLACVNKSAHACSVLCAVCLSIVLHLCHVSLTLGQPEYNCPCEDL
jgi:hypothetical protein